MFAILQPHPLVFEVPFPLYTHALFFLMGTLIATFLFYRINKRPVLPGDEYFLQDTAFIFAIGVICGRIGAVLSYSRAFHSLYEVIAIWQGGLVSFTALLGGLAAVYWRSGRYSGAQKALYVNRVAWVTLIGWGIARIGNYYAADVVGVSSSFWAAFYSRVPISLFEALICFALAAYFYRKPTLLPILISYFALRFLIDFWREEAVLAGLRSSQWTSLVLISILILLYVHSHEKN